MSNLVSRLRAHRHQWSLEMTYHRKWWITVAVALICLMVLPYALQASMGTTWVIEKGRPLFAVVAVGVMCLGFAIFRRLLLKDLI